MVKIPEHWRGAQTLNMPANKAIRKLGRLLMGRNSRPLVTKEGSPADPHTHQALLAEKAIGSEVEVRTATLLQNILLMKDALRIAITQYQKQEISFTELVEFVGNFKSHPSVVLDIVVEAYHKDCKLPATQLLREAGFEAETINEYRYLTRPLPVPQPEIALTFTQNVKLALAERFETAAVTLGWYTAGLTKVGAAVGLGAVATAVLPNVMAGASFLVYGIIGATHSITHAQAVKRALMKPPLSLPTAEEAWQQAELRQVGQFRISQRTLGDRRALSRVGQDLWNYSALFTELSQPAEKVNLLDQFGRPTEDPDKDS